MVERGLVSPAEVDVMRALIDLEERGGLTMLRNAVYHKTYFIDDMAIVVMDLASSSSIPRFIRNARVIEDKLSKVLGRRVKLVPKANDVRSLAMYLLYPARVLGVNTIWLPDGSEEYVVRVSRFDKRFVEKSLKDFERILSEILGKKVQIRIE